MAIQALIRHLSRADVERLIDGDKLEVVDHAGDLLLVRSTTHAKTDRQQIAAKVQAIVTEDNLAGIE